ncbi:hypothetical protein MXB_1524 [Myxobolus squamalis]|nr:hypothetical protein MXB_1524 [Myxobolus squamalis]
MTKYCRCMHYESKGYTARLIVSENKVKEKGGHNCIPQQGNLQVEASEYVKRYIKTQASDLSKNPDEIYRLLLQDLASQYPSTAITILSKKNQQSDTIQQKQRNKSLALRICRNSATFPYKFKNTHIYGDFNKHFHKMLIWTSDEGLAVLRHQGLIFVDGTFRCVPAAFAQCIIIIAWDAASKLFVPSVWALVTAKYEYLYCEFIHNVFILLNYNWIPRCCIVDFEIGLLNSGKYQFTESIIA